jgi:hypothetical protein
MICGVAVNRGSASSVRGECWSMKSTSYSVRLVSSHKAKAVDSLSKSAQRHQATETSEKKALRLQEDGEDPTAKRTRSCEGVIWSLEPYSLIEDMICQAKFLLGGLGRCKVRRFGLDAKLREPMSGAGMAEIRWSWSTGRFTSSKGLRQRWR